MGLWSRIRLLLNVRAAGVLREAEDPGQVLEYAFEQQQELLRKVRQGLVEVATSRVQLERQGDRLRGQIPALEDQARRALAAGREDLARTVLGRKLTISAELEGLDRQLLEVDGEQQKLSVAQQRLTARIEEFRSHRDVVTARYAAARAKVQVSEALGGISGGDLAELSMAVGRAEEKTERLQARASALDALLESGALDTPVGAGDSVEAQLRRLEVAAAVDRELAALRNESAPRLVAGAEEESS